VASPRGEVSASHVEVRQEGSAVVVSDLGSTNGTRVAIPGRRPVSLRQGESIAVLAGTIVDIGDGNRLEILPFTRLIPQEEPHP
jgi:pSer/pThr/pTyr-binding forkhead associated (FHA) protein